MMIIVIQLCNNIEFGCVAFLDCSRQFQKCYGMYNVLYII